MASRSVPLDLSAPAFNARRLVGAGFAAFGAVTVAVLLVAVGSVAFAAAFAAVFAAAAAIAGLVLGRQQPLAVSGPETDWMLVRTVADSADLAVAVTDRDGRLLCANARLGIWFGGMISPSELAIATLDHAASAAGRDGEATIAPLAIGDVEVEGEVTRSGNAEAYLVWHFRRSQSSSALAEATRLVGGETGERFGQAGVMAAVVAGDGCLLAANAVLRQRGLGSVTAPIEGRDFVDLLAADADGLVRFVAEGEEVEPLRFVQIALGPQPDSEALFLLLDEDGSGANPTGKRGTAEIHLHGLLAMLPLGLALVDRDGRFLFINEAFKRAAGLGPGDRPVYPGDLVVKDDKGPVADAVRRAAAGQQSGAGDLAIRLRERPDDPVAMTVASARGLGEAAVLLSLKDNGEEQRLKRQVAQATKMQAVGQLAGGVAHDFNNILTAIIGHCDLMAMRHAPGDSDYDDIQQIKHNSNRAAGLTRQLLAFSRQQTLRPQVLQLPDVVSEVSNLLKRLLGETVTLTVKHGRTLGPVRADPGQLEQVIVNLAVNARDAMPAGGVLTIQTYAVAAAEVAEMRSDIMPTADYTALSVSDTGTGIPPDVIGKIFEPFFTTKEVGKGTGLGLSTVYGIVKQTGGFIFADSEPGVGTSFVIYLPVHHADPIARPERATARERPPELWASGTVLLVEDEDTVRAVAERALSRQGWTVLSAANGEDALELLDREGTVDLLISDVVMPGMDGPTVVRKARARFPDLAVLFISGYAEEQLRRSIDLDRVAFLAKPFSVQQLAQAARDAIPVT